MALVLISNIDPSLARELIHYKTQAKKILLWLEVMVQLKSWKYGSRSPY